MELTSGDNNKKSLSNLLIPNSAERPDENVKQYLSRNNGVGLFLRLMGVVWSDQSSSIEVNVIQCIWSAFIRLGLFLFLICGCYDIIFAFLVPVEEFILYFLFGLTVVIQTLTLAFALREMVKRLLRPVTKFDTLCVESSLKIAYWVCVLSLLIGCIPLTVSIPLSPEHVFYLIIIGLVGEVAISCILTASLYFILTDCRICLTLLDDLIQQQEQHKLTLEQYVEVKDEIEFRHSTSFWVNNSIVFVAIMDIITVITIIFAYSYDGPVVALICCALFLKEIPFLLVVYWQVAQVNEKSYTLTKRLGAKQWDKEVANDYQRVTILVSALSAPISYTLAGMKLKRRDLVWHFFLWLVAFVISIIKSIIESHI